MKGVVFNLLEGFIVDGWGDDKYEEILSLCPLKTKEPFVGPGTYPDSDLVTIATMASEKLGVPLPDALRAFGKYCFPRLVGKFPSFVEGQTDLKEFLKSVDSVIHVEVRKLMPKAITPKFTYEDPGPGQLIIHYQSKRKLCHFMEGLLEGAADHFKTDLHYEQKTCMLEGASTCEFALRFAKADEQAA